MATIRSRRRSGTEVPHPAHHDLGLRLLPNAAGRHLSVTFLTTCGRVRDARHPGYPYQILCLTRRSEMDRMALLSRTTPPSNLGIETRKQGLCCKVFLCSAFYRARACRCENAKTRGCSLGRKTVEGTPCAGQVMFQGIFDTHPTRPAATDLGKGSRPEDILIRFPTLH